MSSTDDLLGAQAITSRKADHTIKTEISTKGISFANDKALRINKTRKSGQRENEFPASAFSFRKLNHPARGMGILHDSGRNHRGIL